MFSGLTNQMSNWIATKREGGSEKVPTDVDTNDVKADEKPTSNATSGLSSPEGKDSTSPPKGGGSRLDMISNVKSHVTNFAGSWFPGRKENAEAGKGDFKPESKPESPTSEKSVKGSSSEQRDDDDDSSATGGADSEGGGSEGTPAEEGHAFGITGVEQMSSKALAGAKSIGSFLVSAVNKAGKTVSEAGVKIKKTVGDTPIVSDFTKEQEEFLKEKQSKPMEPALPPWVGYPDESNLKEEILSLSQDRRNFVRSPPTGVTFEFDFESIYPVAMATLKEDSSLQNMRYELVPKVVNEETFWRNYFYRVSLLRQSTQLSSLAKEGSRDSQSRTSSIDEGGKARESVNDRVPPLSGNGALTANDEFVSDSFQATPKDIEDMQEGIRKLGLNKKDDAQWEAELQAELEDFEMVNSNGGNGNGHTSATGKSPAVGKGDAEWENEIDKMLDAEEDAMDLK